jgi:phosphatidylinositol glycan class M
MTPNIFWFSSFGKMLFALADLGIAYFMQKILQKKKVSTFFVYLWLFNPLAINVSTRGSAESLIGVMVLVNSFSHLSL